MPGDFGTKPKADIRVGKPGEICLQAKIGYMREPVIIICNIDKKIVIVFAAIVPAPSRYTP